MTAKSAILVDFDNVFSTLWDIDKDAAERFASEPGEWLQLLADAYLNGQPRRWLVARCYFNPGGYVPAPGEPRDRLYFSRFRVGLVRAGFDVMDCPSVSRGGKNAADIRIVIDALDLLNHRTRFDEFVIASGDADFTPLLQRLRAEDRRTTVVSPGFLAAAYTASADRVVDYEALRTLLQLNAQAVEEQSSTDPNLVDSDTKQGQERFAELIRRRYSEASRPLAMAALALEADRTIPEARATNWFGKGSFLKAVLPLDLPHLCHSQHHLWDEERHQPPVGAATQRETELPPAVALISRSLDLPRIGRGDWPKVFSTIAEYARTHQFNLTEATRWCRDELANQGVQVARGSIGLIIRGAHFGGVRLDSSPTPTANDVRTGFLASVLDHMTSHALPLDEHSEAAVRAWLSTP